MNCRKCGSYNCSIISETDSHETGYDGASGCCGLILLGPIGLLCGLCGMGDRSTKTRSYSICHDCGHKRKL